MSSAKTSKTSAQPLHASKGVLLDVDGLSVRFDGQAAVNNVSFCVHQGEFVGIIGPNGAGKTTLLRAVLGLLPPSAGQVRKAGAAIGYVPQRGARYDAMVPISVLEVAKLGAAGSPGADTPAGAAEAAMRALRAVNMHHAVRKRFSELSGGQQQRVFIAKALAANAGLLILDEPATGIDEPAQAAFYALLQKLRQDGITVIMVSHEVDTVLRLVTRVICLNRTILYDGPPEHFEADKYLPSHYRDRHRQLHHHHGDGDGTGGAHA